ncbi:hypothetical protein CHH80_12300 [Bacillus sp. 7504-2]|nr:hypothetical protein CHH80_12300 [Bacillus sp. 7504-2]
MKKIVKLKFGSFIRIWLKGRLQSLPFFLFNFTTLTVNGNLKYEIMVCFQYFALLMKRHCFKATKYSLTTITVIINLSDLLSNSSAL